MPYIYVTTTGHKSGKPHEIEIWFVAHEGSFYLVAERRERTHWVQNIQHNPALQFRIGDRTNGPGYVGRGRVIDPAVEPALAETVRQLMDAKYGWSDGLIVELIPVQGL